MIEPTKHCNACEEDKPHSAFGTVKPGRGDRFNLASRCKSCRSARNLRWHYDNRERARKNRKASYDKNADQQRAASTKWRLENPEWHSANYRDWALRNRAKLTAKENERRAAKMRATPPWLTDRHRKEIQMVFEKAAQLTAATGIPHHVDHIVPLKGKSVSGLHVPWNLQILTAFENISKKTRYDKTVAASGIVIGDKKRVSFANNRAIFIDFSWLVSSVRCSVDACSNLSGVADYVPTAVAWASEVDLGDVPDVAVFRCNVAAVRMH